MSDLTKIQLAAILLLGLAVAARLHPPGQIDDGAIAARAAEFCADMGTRYPAERAVLIGKAALDLRLTDGCPKGNSAN